MGVGQPRGSERKAVMFCVCFCGGKFGAQELGVYFLEPWHSIGGSNTRLVTNDFEDMVGLHELQG